MKRSLTLPLLATVILTGPVATASWAGDAGLKSHEEARKHRRTLERNQWYVDGGTVFIAHRGASGYAPENTVPAFEKAVEMRAAGCELDVHLSKDDQIMVIHDSTLERTTNGKGKVAECDSEYIRSLDAGEKFAPEFKDTKVPYLSEMIDTIKGKSILVCEVKAGMGQIEKGILDLIEEKGIEDAVTVISFNGDALKNVRALDKEMITMYLKGAPREEIDGKTVYHPIPLSILDEAEELDVDALNLYYQGVTPELVKAAHERDFKLYCWTVNSTEEAIVLLRMGADGITGNYPDRLHEALRNLMGKM